MNAVIYARYSSGVQREESIEGQLRVCHEYAAKNNLTIIHEYLDPALSGRTDKRKEFQHMISDASKRRFEVILVYSLDRFARNRYDSAIYKARLKKLGVRVLYATQSFGDGPESIIIESVMEGYAEYYSANLAVVTKRGLTENALHGKSAGGATPLGYSLDKATKQYIINDAEAAIVRLWFERYAAGATITAIITESNLRGFRNRQGKPFTKHSVYTVLTNERYTGTYIWGDVRVEGAMPVIIDRALFDKVQSLYQLNTSRRARAKATVPYLLTGRLFCGCCGAPMVGDCGTGKLGHVYHYYACAAHKRNPASCPKQNEKKDDLEAMLASITSEAVLTPEMIAEISATAARLMRKEADNSSLIIDLNRQKAEVSRKIENILRALEEGITTPSTRQRLEQLEERRDQLAASLSEASMRKPILSAEQIAFFLSKLAASKDDRRFLPTILDAFLARATVTDTEKGKKITVTYNLTGDRHSEAELCSDSSVVVAHCRQYPNMSAKIGPYALIVEMFVEKEK